jgi:hypothetical protein
MANEMEVWLWRMNSEELEDVFEDSVQVWEDWVKLWYVSDMSYSHR